jgi:hypothetical protein
VTHRSLSFAVIYRSLLSLVYTRCHRSPAIL